MVLYSYHMMYSNIVKELVFRYIEHSILRYDFVYDIIMYLFQVLPLLHWIFEFSKDKDYVGKVAYVRELHIGKGPYSNWHIQR